MLLKFAIQEFLEDRKFKNLTEITVKGYERSLKAFHDYIIQQHQILNIEDVRPITSKPISPTGRKNGKTMPKPSTTKYAISKHFSTTL